MSWLPSRVHKRYFDIFTDCPDGTWRHGIRLHRAPSATALHLETTPPPHVFRSTTLILSFNRKNSLSRFASFSVDSTAMVSLARESAYLSQLSESAGIHHPIRALLNQRQYGSPRACFYNETRAEVLVAAPEKLLEWASLPQGDSVCVVENISPQWMARLGSAWGLDTSFFLHHVDRRERKNLWDSVMSQTVEEWGRESRQHGYIEIVLPYVSKDEARQDNAARAWEYSERYGWQKTTRISNYRVSGSFCTHTALPPLQE